MLAGCSSAPTTAPSSPPPRTAPAAAPDGGVFLTGLGFSIIQAQTALQHVPREVRAMDERVQAALQHLDQTGQL